MAMLKRSALIHYLDSTFTIRSEATSWKPEWFKIGQHIDDMSVELNPDTETIKNIWDENNMKDNGYEPSFSADPYYANPADSIYPNIKNITMNRLTGDDCKTSVMEVIIDSEEGPWDAWVEDVYVKPKTYGGPQGGVNIPYEVTFAGNRTKGTVTIANKIPTFTAALTTTEAG